VVRIEAALNTFSGSIGGSSGGTMLTFPTAPIPANVPTLRITSVNGVSVPGTPLVSLVTPDITFSQAVSSVNVVVSASNVPSGTTVSLKVVPATGAPTTSTTSGLTGNDPLNMSASGTVTLPPGSGVITASATFQVQQMSALLPNGVPTIDGEKPQQVEVLARADGTSGVYLVSRSGARFELGQAHPGN
jgi:hypothetical protein